VIEELILKRKSIRQFNSSKIPDEMIYKAIEVAKFAPSGKNRQPWKVKILSETEKPDILDLLNNKKNELDDPGSLSVSIKAISQSSHTLFIYNPYSYTEEPYPRNKLLMDTQSTGAFIQNLLLYFTEQNVASVWINDVYYARKEIEKYMNDYKNELVAAVALGYSDLSRNYNLRDSLDEILL